MKQHPFGITSIKSSSTAAVKVLGKWLIKQVTELGAQEEALVWHWSCICAVPPSATCLLVIGWGHATGAQKPKKGRRQAKHSSTARAHLLKLVWFPKSVPTKVCLFNWWQLSAKSIRPECPNIFQLLACTETQYSRCLLLQGTYGLPRPAHCSDGWRDQYLGSSCRKTVLDFRTATV